MTIVKELNNLSKKVTGKEGKATTDAQAVKFIADNYEGGGSYELPTASASTLGGVKVGDNLSIDANGVLSATGGGSSVEPIIIDIGEYFVNAEDEYYDNQVEFYSQVIENNTELLNALLSAYETWNESKGTPIYIYDSENKNYYEVNYVHEPISAQDPIKFEGGSNGLYTSQNKGIRYEFCFEIDFKEGSLVITTGIKETELATA